MRRIGAWLLLGSACAAGAWGPRVIALQTGAPDDAIRHALDRGTYDEAERQAANSYAQVKKTHGPDSIELARASDLLVEALIRNGKSATSDARQLADAAVQSKERRLGADSPEVAVSIHNLGTLGAARGEFRAAVAFHTRALALRRRAFGPDSAESADSLDATVRALIELERFQEAQESLDRALRVRAQQSAESPLALARTLELAGRVGWRAGRYGDAAAALDRALAIWDQHAPAHPDKTATLIIRGEVYQLAGNIAAAHRTWSDALRLALNTLRPEHPLIAVAKRSLAHGETALGHIAEARLLREDGLRIAERWLPQCDPEVAGQLNDLGLSRMDHGDFVAARTLFRREAAVAEKCLGPVNNKVAQSIYNEFQAARQLGANADAERLGTLAIRIWSEALGATHPFVAYGAYQLATFEASRKKFARARVLFEQSLKIRRQALGISHPDVALTLIPYARMLADSGSHGRAESFLQEAIRILRAAPARFADATAQALEVRALLQKQQGDYEAARATLAEAVAEKERIYGASHPYVATTRAEVAGVDFALSRYDEALAAALITERAGRDVLRYNVRSLPERRALDFAAQRPRGLDLMLSIAAAGQAKDTPALFDSVIRSRGVVLDELAARAQATDRSDAKQAALARARERVASLTMRSLQGDTIDTAVLADAQKQKEDAEETVAEQSAAARAELARAKLGLADVRRSLPSRSALVSFARYDRTTFTTTGSRITSRVVPSYIAFVARSSDDIVTVPLGTAAALENAITTWRTEVDGGTLASAASPADAERTYRVAGARLRARVWDSIAKHLGDVDRVFIVPDGAINTISFAALPTAASKYLIESPQVIHYLTTERDLVETASTGSLGSTGSAGSRGLLAVGGPAYGPASATQTTAAIPDCGGGPLVFEDLPGSRAEVLDIARLWAPNAFLTGDPLPAPTVLSGRAANKAAVMKMAAGRQVVHLATHGFFLGAPCTTTPANTRGVGGLIAARPKGAEDNALLLSGLAFAGANQRSKRAGADNGILTAEEIVSLNLQGTEWAVLSACDTGLGQIKTGEGVFGLRRAFQIAGVRTVITSLWSVEDETTRLWMRTLYEGRLRQHLSTADAVRAAGLRVLRDRRTRGQSSHPFYWGAFVAAGDWR
jgi:CHAT domain-containing protein